MKWVPRAFRRIDTGTLKEAFRVFSPALEGQKKAAAGSIALAMLVVFFEVIQPWPIKVVFDHFLDAKKKRGFEFLRGIDPDAALVGAVVSLLIIAILLGTLRIVMAVVAARVGRRVTTRVRKRVFDHLHRLNFPFHLRSKIGDLLVRIMGDVNMIRDMLFTSWIGLVQRGMTFLAMAAVMLAFDPFLALLALIPIPLLGFVVRKSSRKLKSVTRKQRAKEGSAASFAAESLRQIRVVKAYSAEGTATRTFTRDSRSGERAGAEAAKISADMARWGEILTACGLALVLWYGAHEVRDGHLGAGTLWIFISYARSVYKPLRGMSKEGLRLGRATVCAERLLEVLRETAEDATAGEPAPRFEGTIAFENVEMTYASGVPAIRGFSASVPAGALAVIAGANGSGKSTMLALLLRLLEPGSGRVLVDGEPISRWSLGSYRARFAYVPQEIQLFGATIRENILYGRPDASMEDVEAAARAVLIHDVIEQMPDGYETELGEAGSTLSGGEARRIMLARAALRDARILLLDEPLAGIDPASRPLVAQAIRRISAARTTLIVSHETIDDIDPHLILHLEAGRLERAEERRPVEAVG